MPVNCSQSPKETGPQRGFTLTEVLVVIVLAAITTTLVVPSFQNLIKNQRITAASNELLTSLTLARSTAISTRRQSVVCPSEDSAAAEPVCSGDWHDGWIVFTDLDGNGEVSPPLETLWEQHPALPGAVKIAAAGAMATRIRFQPIGTAPGFNGTFAICDDRGGDSEQRHNMRELVLAFAGRVRIQPGDGETRCP